MLAEDSTNIKTKLECQQYFSKNEIKKSKFFSNTGETSKIKGKPISFLKNKIIFS